MTPADAETTLSKIPEYNWLTKSSQQWWTVQQVAVGMGVGESVVRQRCTSGEIQGAYLASQQAGWRIPRSGLLVFLANLYSKGAALS